MADTVEKSNPVEPERLDAKVESAHRVSCRMAGTAIHRGGANRSDKPRLAFTNQYCEPWARTQENFFLGIPPEQARAMPPRLQRLLGYDIWPPFMGMVSSVHPKKALEPGWIPPVVAQALT